MTELLSPAQYDEYEQFVQSSPFSNFMQSVKWAQVKENWAHEIVVSRNRTGEIRGGMLLLLRRIVPGITLLYAPRGPVCDLLDREAMEDLLAGAKKVAKKHNSFGLKIDPPVSETDHERIAALQALGFGYTPDAAEYDTIQRRYNYLLPNLTGKTPEALLASFKQKCRYNIRVAERHGVTCRAYGTEGINDFLRLSRITSERDHFDIRSYEYYARMLTAFGPEQMRIFLCSYQGQTISGAMTANYGGVTSYIYGASDNAFRNVMPNYLMQWQMIRWALETSCKAYDFMGISAKLDPASPMYGVYRFKAGFNGSVAAYAGEFDLVFSPARENLFQTMVGVKKELAHLRHERAMHAAKRSRSNSTGSNISGGNRYAE